MDEHPCAQKVGPDGKCVMTGYPCKCIPKTGGHWCCWSIPEDEIKKPAEPGNGNNEEKQT